MTFEERSEIIVAVMTQLEDLEESRKMFIKFSNSEFLSGEEKEESIQRAAKIRERIKALELALEKFKNEV